MTEIAKKGAFARTVLTLAILVVLAGTAYVASVILAGYAFEGTYGALAFPTLLAGVWTLWSLRGLARNIYTDAPLIFIADDSLHYVAFGHAPVRLAEVACFSVRDGTFPRAYFYDAAGEELRRYSLFLSDTAPDEVTRRLSGMGLLACKHAPMIS